MFGNLVIISILSFFVYNYLIFSKLTLIQYNNKLLLISFIIIINTDWMFAALMCTVFEFSKQTCNYQGIFGT